MSRSLVAGVNALFRMRESARAPGQRLLEDPWAGRLGERGVAVTAVRLLRFVLPGLRRLIDELQTAHCVRHRSVDELVLQARRDGFEQLVLVGAGYDMRAARFATALRGAAVFEMDHPATAARKARLLRGHHGGQAVVRATADLMRESLGAALGRVGFDGSRPACFVLEGLVHYLSRQRLHALLDDICAGPGRRRVVLSFIRPDVATRASRMFVRLVKLLREVPRLHFTAGELSAALSRRGFGAVTTWTYQQQLAAFAPEGRGRRAGVAQDVARSDRAAQVRAAASSPWLPQPTHDRRQDCMVGRSG